MNERLCYVLVGELRPCTFTVRMFKVVSHLSKDCWGERGTRRWGKVGG